MTTYLSLPNASVARLIGWGRAAKPDDYDHRIELVDVGVLAVYGTPLLREKQIMAMSIEDLEITACTAQVTTDGGYRASYSVGDVLLQSRRPSRIRRVPGKTREYTLLCTRTMLPNGTQREADFAFRWLNESDLRDQLAPAIHAWADGYVKHTLTQLDLPPGHNPDLQAAFAKIDRMRNHGLLDSGQALILCSHASQPFITAVRQKLRAGQTNRSEAEQLRGTINDLHHAQRLTDSQATEINSLVSPIITPARSDPPSEARLRQLELLAQLRQTGALTEDEFQAETARLLHPAASR